MTDRNEHGQAAGDVFGLQDVRELLRLISETDVTEIQIERGDAKLHIKRGSVPAAPQYMMTPSLAASLPNGQSMPYMMPVTPAALADADQVPEGLAITSPMVGTFYTSPSPRDPVFVSEGDQVQAGDVVGIVEAMKIMNEIESEVSGRVIRILVANGQPVEYGQPLMIVEAN